MKYIIDVPDNTTWIQVSTDRLILYTEPDQKAIDLQHAHDIENVARMNYSKGAEDAWEFAKRIICPSDCCDDSISRHTKEIFGKEGWETRGIFVEMTYQEAKEKYEAWKAEKEEIRVGDEVVVNGTRAVVMKLDETGNIDRYFTSNGTTFGNISGFQNYEVTKTNRHFPEVAELLKKMKGSDED